MILSGLLLSACNETNSIIRPVVDREMSPAGKGGQVKQGEYIIVLVENVSIIQALSTLNKYEVQVIRDLKKGRYLIKLTLDPGIERLKVDIEGSSHIEFIQSNYKYKIQ